MSQAGCHSGGEKQAALVARFGVQKAAISKIVHRKTWAHV